MEIDLHSLKPSLLDRLPWPDTPSGEYYFRFQLPQGRYTLDHFGSGGKVRYNSFFVGSDGTIATRTKYQVLLSGAFGTVYAKSTYFYGPEYHDQPTEFFCASYFNGLGSEPYQVISALPANDTNLLSGISVIRIFHSPPEFLIASANYAPDGHLESLHVNGAKQGEWVHSNQVHALYPGLEVATMIGDRPDTRMHFGLPVTFPVYGYRGRPAGIFDQVNLESVLDVVNFHYRRNLWVRQDLFSPLGAHTTRILAYVDTSEDKALAPIDDSHVFGQFLYLRKLATN